MDENQFMEYLIELLSKDADTVYRVWYDQDAECVMVETYTHAIYSIEVSKDK